MNEDIEATIFPGAARSATGENSTKTIASSLIASRLREFIEPACDKTSFHKWQKIWSRAGISGRIDSEGFVVCFSFEA